jgi:FF domain
MDPLDILIAFEDHVLALDSQFRQAMNSKKRTAHRHERHIRDGFRSLLKEYKDAGVIGFKSKWKDLYPMIKGDERYTNMLGNPGSNPLDMFWDYQINLEDAYRADKRTIYDLMKVAYSLPSATTTTLKQRPITKVSVKNSRKIWSKSTLHIPRCTLKICCRMKSGIRRRSKGNVLTLFEAYLNAWSQL